MIIRTLNSWYEVDEVHMRARRLDGMYNPTPRFGEDEAWRTYAEVERLEVGASMVIRWPTPDPDRPDADLRTHTISSTVLEITR